METNIKHTATVKFTKQELIDKLNSIKPLIFGIESELRHYTITDIEDVQRVEYEQSIYPSDAYRYEIFDGIKLILERTNN
jgi:hypothetical protein